MLRSIVIVLKSSTWKCDRERESGMVHMYDIVHMLRSIVIVLKSSTWKCDGEIDGYICWNQRVRQTDGQRSKLEARANGLWEGLSHSALLRSIGIVLKVPLRFAAFDCNCFEGCSCKN